MSKITLSVFALIAFILVTVLFWVNYPNTIPEAPLYPNAILTHEFSLKGEGVFYPLVSNSFESNDSQAEVVSFYEQDGDCIQSEFFNYRVVCSGNAVPFGKYSVYIDKPTHAEPLTAFTVEITWER